MQPAELSSQKLLCYSGVNMADPIHSFHSTKKNARLFVLFFLVMLHFYKFMIGNGLAWPFPLDTFQRG